jgi:hypothetical protein
MLVHPPCPSLLHMAGMAARTEMKPRLLLAEEKPAVKEPATRV